MFALWLLQTGLISPGDVRKVVSQWLEEFGFQGRGRGGGGCIIAGACGRTGRPLGCSASILSLYINHTFLDSFSGWISVIVYHGSHSRSSGASTQTWSFVPLPLEEWLSYIRTDVFTTVICPPSLMATSHISPLCQANKSISWLLSGIVSLPLLPTVAW